VYICIKGGPSSQDVGESEHFVVDLGIFVVITGIAVHSVGEKAT